MIGLRSRSHNGLVRRPDHFWTCLAPRCSCERGSKARAPKESGLGQTYHCGISNIKSYLAAPREQLLVACTDNMLCKLPPVKGTRPCLLHKVRWRPCLYVGMLRPFLQRHRQGHKTVDAQGVPRLWSTRITLSNIALDDWKWWRTLDHTLLLPTLYDTRLVLARAWTM